MASPGGESAASPPSVSHGWRVKLYQLNDDGQWDDRGTGSIRVKHVEAAGGTAIHVTQEDNGRDLLQSRISDDREAYSLQGENIITWEERRAGNASIDLALSFQENEGCLQIWSQIQEIQGNLVSEGGPRMEVEGWGAPGEIGPQPLSADSSPMSTAAEATPLPECRVNNLKQVHEQLSNANMAQKEGYAAMLMEGNNAYLGKLFNIFADCEDLEDSDNLVLLAQISKAIVLLNDVQLIEELIKTSNPFFEQCLGCLEYDPELKFKAEHRAFLEKHSKFREVLSMDDMGDLRDKIRNNFRATFLKDAMMRPGLDESSLSTLTSYVFFNNSEILNKLHQNTDYLQRLVELLRKPSPKPASADEGATDAMYQSRYGVLLFLKEMCTIAKNVQLQCREALYQYLLQDTNFFEAITPLLADRDASPMERLFGAEILSNIVAFDAASSFRMYILKTAGHPSLPPWASTAASAAGPSSAAEVAAEVGEGPMPSSATGGASEGEKAADGSGGAAGGAEGGSLLSHVVRLMVSDPDTGVSLHLFDVIKVCLDTDTMEQAERDSFLTVFYDHYIHWLVEPFMLPSSTSAAGSAAASRSTSPMPPQVPASSASAGAAASGDAPPAATSQTSPPPPPPPSSASSSASASTDSLANGAAKAGGVRVLTESQKSAHGHVCDLLSYCVKAHTYRIKYFVLRNNLVGKVMELLQQKDKFLKLAALRFVRACIGVKDDFYNRYLVKNSLLTPVFALFQANDSRDNLINSAIIDIVEHIRTENIKSLVEHVVENFADVFKGVEYVQTFKAIVLKYEQNLEMRGGGSADLGTEGGGNGIASAAEQHRKKVAQEDEDEAYFGEGDDDEIGPQPAPGSLVSYADDPESPGGSSPSSSAGGDTTSGTDGAEGSGGTGGAAGPKEDSSSSPGDEGFIPRQTAAAEEEEAKPSPGPGGLGRVFDIQHRPSGAVGARSGGASKPLGVRKIEFVTTSVDIMNNPNAAEADTAKDGTPADGAVANANGPATDGPTDGAAGADSAAEGDRKRQKV